MQFLTTIGIILALIGAVLIWKLKAPLQTSDWLLITILVTFIAKFALDEVFLLTGNSLFSSMAVTFGVSSIVSCGWYIKFLTREGKYFSKKELFSYLPLLVLLVLIILLSAINISAELRRILYGTVLAIMVCLIFYYFYFCIRMLQKHKQLIRDNYSDESGSITVYWMVIIISLQIAEFVLKIVLINGIGVYKNTSIQLITNEYCFIIETFLLVILGVWQKSIPVFIAPANPSYDTSLENNDLTHYQKKLKTYMETEKPYLDPELTLDKLSDLVRIKKLLLSETLNKGLNKNFFTFIKEYRIAHVEQLLKNRDADGRTILDLAYQSGFNSKTGFNRAFKEVTGKTPTDYLQR